MGEKSEPTIWLALISRLLLCNSRRTQEDYSWLRQLPFGSRFGKADTSNREDGISARHQFGVLPAERDELCEEGGSHRLRHQFLIRGLKQKNLH